MSKIDQPRDAADLVALVKEAKPLAVSGTGTREGLGHQVTGRPVSLAGFAGIADYQPEELVMTAGPGTTIRALRAALDQAGQHLAFEIPDHGPLYGKPAGEGTLGGLLMTATAGSRRISAGSVRDHFLGFTGVNGKGEIFKAGGKVVKNVTGYDLPKLLAGSFGTLALLTEATIKTLPRPETATTLLIDPIDESVAFSAMSLALGSAHEVSGAAYLPQDLFGLGGPKVAVRLEGFEASVKARASVLAEELKAFGSMDPMSGGDLWQHISDAAPLVGKPDLILWRLSVAPMEGAEVLKAVGAHEVAWFDWGGGLIWLGLAPGEADGGAARVRAAVAGKGHATLVRAPDAIRASVPVFQPQGALAPLAARVKASFDPLGIFNPGRMG
ncbi:FAD-binding protein [Lacibacterium aquatile]|uniref:FAD-binding protein n=1 Tax=Lacibacterium aquatile TaxID=1168082 RepID=A0ABW5DV56_9PROT